MDMGAALVGLVTAFGVKLVVMFLGARLLMRLFGVAYRPAPKRLWLLVPPEDLGEVKLLSWALGLFFFSELTCGVEVYILFNSSPVTGVLHGLTSALGMGLFAVGILGLVDRKLLSFANPQGGCTVHRICRGCTLHQPPGCKFRTLTILLGFFLAMASLPPLLAPTQTLFADARRLILPFPALNAWYDDALQPWLQDQFGYVSTGIAFSFPKVVMDFEFKVLPVLGMVAAIWGGWLARSGREALALKYLAFCAGVLAYVYLELSLNLGLGDFLLGALFHELAEFWFLLVTAELLRRLFHPPEEQASWVRGKQTGQAP